MYPFIARWITALDHLYTPVLNPAIVSIEATPRERVMNMTLQSIAKSTSIIPSTSAASIGSNVPVISRMTIPLIRYIGPKFRVKLSYPDTTSAVLATADGKT